MVNKTYVDKGLFLKDFINIHWYLEFVRIKFLFFNDFVHFVCVWTKVGSEDEVIPDTTHVNLQDATPVDTNWEVNILNVGQTFFLKNIYIYMCVYEYLYVCIIYPICSYLY